MIISGFDIATLITGFCVGDGSTTPLTDVYEFPMVGDDIGKLGSLWNRYLTIHYEKYRPDAVIYEKPILTSRDRPLVLRKIYGMGFALETFFRDRGVPCHEVTLQDIKKEITGNAMSKKPPMVAIARRVGLALPKTGEEDATDAWGAWLLGLRSYSPEISRTWDSVIHNPRVTGRWLQRDGKLSDPFRIK